MSIIRFNRSFPFSNFLEDFFGKDLIHFPQVEQNVPSVNIIENENGFRVEVAAPGLKKEDFKVSIDNNVLTISAEAKQEKEEKNERYTRREFSHTSFQRSFTLPQTIEIDQIDAKYEDGILHINLPKKEEAKPKPTRVINIS
ncbi:MAG: Hsp20/alpha crystallin family protein [Bacteroidia bacterium]|nr:Hsp20/alpha crystallin family protein [Bacteroidia bacterium]MDW8300820.1 Hsp20/alpha crystallin family protein [Bacteroidia bacterium]